MSCRGEPHSAGVPFAQAFGKKATSDPNNLLNYDGIACLVAIRAKVFSINPYAVQGRESLVTISASAGNLTKNDRIKGES